jgi:uncharacterized protein YecE (DUF72 family)
VEINNTFYRMPRRSVLEGWSAQVPASFRFAIKATRRITHFKKLADTTELLSYLASGFFALGSGGGVVLFQLPPTLRADLVLLDEFLKTLDETARFAVQASKHSDTEGPQARLRAALEFRHPSWFSDQVFTTLQAHQVALVGGDQDEGKDSPPLVKTAPHLYLRLRKSAYAPGEVQSWAERIAALSVKQVYAYFKHEELGPQLALQLEQTLSGLSK